jgi:hypothetical protein
MCVREIKPVGASRFVRAGPARDRQPGLFVEFSVCINFLRHSGKGLQFMAQMTVL